VERAGIIGWNSVATESILLWGIIDGARDKINLLWIGHTKIGWAMHRFGNRRVAKESQKEKVWRQEMRKTKGRT